MTIDEQNGDIVIENTTNSQEEEREEQGGNNEYDPALSKQSNMDSYGDCNSRTLISTKNSKETKESPLSEDKCDNKDSICGVIPTNERDNLSKIFRESSDQLPLLRYRVTAYNSLSKDRVDPGNKGKTKKTLINRLSKNKMSPSRTLHKEGKMPLEEAGNTICFQAKDDNDGASTNGYENKMKSSNVTNKLPEEVMVKNNLPYTTSKETSFSSKELSSSELLREPNILQQDAVTSRSIVV